jgi:hypothetical protein
VSVEDRQEWLTLDNAARIYPSALTEWSPDVYRVSVTLKAPIRVTVLQEALRGVFPRFPYFQVHLERGLFWYYLQRDQEIPPVYEMSAVPVSVMPTQKGSHHLLRVQAGGATIAVDFSHVLTDGVGAIRFLGTLATQYLRLQGIQVRNWEPFLDPGESPSPGEYEDAYKRHCDPGLPGPARLSVAYHLPDEAQECSRVITGRVRVGDMLALVRSQGVSVTEYLVALYMHALTRIRSSGTDGRGTVRIEVPVDMRRLYPSETMRNFSLFVSPEIDASHGAWSFDEIVQRVHHDMRLQAGRRELDRQMARNVRVERNPFVRVLPLFLKDMMFSYVRRRFGEDPYSGVLSNLGRIVVPEDIADHVVSFSVMLGPNPRMKNNCVVFSFGDDLFITFGSVIECRELERLFFTHLVRAGIPVYLVERSSAS